MSSLINFYKNKTINNTTLFFSPILAHLIGVSSSNTSFLGYIAENGFINAYIEDNIINEDRCYKNCIFIYFKDIVKGVKSSVTFKNTKFTLHEWIISRKCCIDFIEEQDNICYVIEIGDKYNFNNILLGIYSDFPNDILQKYSSNLKINKKDYHVKYLNYVISKSSSLKKLLVEEFNSKELSNYHSQFDNSLDVYNGIHEVFNFKNSNLVFEKIVREIANIEKK